MLDAGEVGIDGADITLTGMDDRGDAVVVTASTSLDGTYTFANLRPGSYTLTESQPPAYVDGQDSVGSLGGTLGPDQISGIVVMPDDAGIGYDFGEVATTAISGSVIDDLDNDGMRDVGEPGIAGVTVTLTGIDDLGDPVSLTTTTDAFGRYGFVALRPGTYTLTESQPGGYLDGKDTAGPLGGTAGDDIVTGIVLGSGQSAAGNVFGELTASSLAGAVFVDLDGDGSFGAGEVGIGGATVTLTGTDDLGAAVSAATATAGDGSYVFSNLRPGTYVIAEDQPAGYYDGVDSVGTQGGAATADDELTVPLAPATDGTGNTFAELLPASIGDFVWLDVDDDGIQDPAQGIDGATVNLYAADGATLLATTTTSAGGSYGFAGLEPFQTYVVEVTAPPGAAFTTLPGTDDSDDSDVGVDGRVTVVPESGANSDVADAGIAPASLAGTVWFDVDTDGVRDAGEVLLSGVTVELRDGDGALVATMTTAAGGAYLFSGVLPGDYVVTVVYPDAAFAGPGADSDVDPITGTASVTLDSGLTSDGGDAGVQPAVIGDLVWLDLDADGSRDTGEPGIGGVGVALLDAIGAELAVAVTNAAGMYTFSVLPGDYEVTVTAPAGGAFTAEGAAAEGIDSDVDATGATGLLALASGSHVELGDAGVVPAEISGQVWIDVDADGLNDDAAPLGGVTVELFDGMGVFLAAATTAGDGSYLFAGLVPADYTIVVVPPDGAPFTSQGGDSDVDPATGAAFVTASGSATVDAGILPGYVTGIVWLDLDGSGAQNSGEPGAGGVALSLFDGGGVVVATTTTAGDGSYSFGPLTPGDYVIVVDETGLPSGVTQTADPDGVADGATEIMVALGDTIGDLDFGYRPFAAIEGVVFGDFDGDGIRDAGEPGLSGIDLLVTDADGAVTVVTTAVDGSYSVAVVPGAASIEVDPATVPDGAELTTGNDAQLVTAASNVVTPASPIGYQLASDVSGLIWNDLDGDGVRDAGEPGIAGVTVILVDDAGGVAATTVTGSDGAYLFADVPIGDYQVQVDTEALPPGLDTPTYTPDGDDDTVVAITVTAGGDITGLDFGYRPDGSISGTVWEDRDGDGTRDLGEPGLPGVDVIVTWFGPDAVAGGGDDETYTTTTAADGSYSVGGLQPGTYGTRVDEATLPTGLAASAGTATVDLAAGEARMDVDFGFVPAVDLEVIISSNVSTVAPGDQVTFTFTIANNGPHDEYGPIQVAVALGYDLVMLSGGGDGWTSEVVDGQVIFTYAGGLQVGAQLTFFVTALVMTVVDADLNVTGTVHGTGLDTNLTNNTRTTTIGSLPFTGLPADSIVRWALLMLLVGGLLVLLTRRRQEGADTSP